MGRAFVSIYLVAIIISFACSGVLGCSCRHTHPQTLFCTRDFVFLGEVVSKVLVNADPQDPANNHATWTYRVRLITRIKGISNTIGSIVQIQTPGNSGLCGVTLEDGERYILTGSNQNGKRVVILCDWIVREQDLSTEQRRYLFGTNSNTYKANCMCKEIVDNGESVPHTEGCKLHDDSHDTTCYSKKALCKRRNGFCDWINNSDC